MRQCKIIKPRVSFPNDEAAFKLSYLALRNAAKKWTVPIPHWNRAMQAFSIIYEGRVPTLDGNLLSSTAAYKMGGFSMHQFNENLQSTLPANQFLEVISGRKVEMQIGEMEATAAQRRFTPITWL